MYSGIGVMGGFWEWLFDILAALAYFAYIDFSKLCGYPIV